VQVATERKEAFLVVFQHFAKVNVKPQCCMNGFQAPLHWLWLCSHAHFPTRLQVLGEHLDKCRQEGTEMETPWFRVTLARFQQTGRKVSPQTGLMLYYALTMA